LQAIGIKKENFAEYEGQPPESIYLNFHVLASGQKIESKVVAWLPYSLDSGDVAALKLLTSAPTGAKPIPLVEFERAEVENDQHSVYGFGKSHMGGRSDAYRPKANAAGGRFQLCKFGDPNDETIKPGFSGAPVWNEAKQCVIGIVATAVETQTTAYAIPTKAIRSVLKKIEAFCLQNVLTQCLDCCDSSDDQYQLNLAISKALRYCNPNGGDHSWQNQLLVLSTDRAPAPVWEAEGRLVQFVMMLVKMDDISLNTYDALQDWVNNLCHFDFLALLERITREMKQQKISSGNVCQHLMVVVEQKETSIDKLRVSMWAVEDRNTYDPYKPPSPTIPEKILTIAELPDFIRQQIRQKFRKSSTPTIHLFLPRALFGCDIEMQHCGKAGAALGSEYPFVVRTNLKTHPISYYYYDDWNEKWEKIVTASDVKTDLFFTTVDCSMPETNLIEDLALINAAMLQNWDSVGELFGMIAEETALPVAIWSRDTQFQDNLSDVLDGIVEKLRYRIQQERNTAHRSPSKPLLGHHLSLIWEDPKIVPPDMQFDPEAC
jgi:vWA-MoxR associated protein C-terminal domain/vWA-MoxR associated protein middle region (VMAP-M) 1